MGLQAHVSDLVLGLYLYSLWAKNDLRIFKLIYMYAQDIVSDVSWPSKPKISPVWPSICWPPFCVRAALMHPLECWESLCSLFSLLVHIVRLKILTVWWVGWYYHLALNLPFCISIVKKGALLQELTGHLCDSPNCIVRFTYFPGGSFVFFKCIGWSL